MSRGLTPLLVAVWLIAAFSACSPPLTVSQQVIAAIREMETRIEDGERRQFIKHVSEDFSGQNGQLNRQQLMGLVIYQLNRHQRLHAQLFPISVNETGEQTASANFRALNFAEAVASPVSLTLIGKSWACKRWWRFS